MSVLPVFTPPLVAYSFDNVTLDTSTNFTGSNDGAYFLAPDGQRLVAQDETIDDLRYKDLTTPWSLTSAGSTSTILLTPTAGASDYGRGLRFNTDGSKVFTGTNNGFGVVEEYSLSGSYQGTSTQESRIDTASAASNLQDFDFNADGTLLVITANATFNSYTLSTGFDLSTAGAKSATLLDMSGDYSFVDAFSFARDGTRLVCGVSDGTAKVAQATLSTPYDVSTAGTFEEVSLSAITSNSTRPSTVFYGRNGTRLYVEQGGTLYGLTTVAT